MRKLVVHAFLLPNFLLHGIFSPVNDHFGRKFGRFGPTRPIRIIRELDLEKLVDGDLGIRRIFDNPGFWAVLHSSDPLPPHHGLLDPKDFDEPLPLPHVDAHDLLIEADVPALQVAETAVPADGDQLGKAGIILVTLLALHQSDLATVIVRVMSLRGLACIDLNHKN